MTNGAADARPLTAGARTTTGGGGDHARFMDTDIRAGSSTVAALRHLTVLGCAAHSIPSATFCNGSHVMM